MIANDAGTFDDIVATANGDAPSLADDQDFVDTMAGLPEARLGMAYVAPDDLLAALDRMQGPGLSDLGTAAGIDPEAMRGIGLTLAAEPDALAMDSEVTIDASKLTPEQLDAYGAEDHENVQLAMVPADALGFVGAQHLDSGLDAALGRPALGSARGARPERARAGDHLAQRRPRLRAVDAVGLRDTREAR